MRRDAGELPPDVAAAEQAADLLALELLAPREEVLSLTPPVVATGGLAKALRTRFGLPEKVAREYAAMLTPQPIEAEPLLLRLRKALADCRTSAIDGE
jgi:hypothetical protein